LVQSLVKRMAEPYSEAERSALYRAIRERRDVRSGYVSQPLDDETLHRLLLAAHHAPSVGFMQPWRFIVVRDKSLRESMHEIFLRANADAGATYGGERGELYSKLKLEGLLEAPQHLCVVCDPTSERGHRLGRHTMPQMPVFSVVCAIQNLWLAARAEGIGVGWISILDPAAVKDLLRIPAESELVAYLCVGHVDNFAQTPDLERFGWEKREDLATLARADYFDCPYSFQETRK
jgi:5,6-dimethylbenzimidazole synthase